MEKINNVDFIKGDFLEIETQKNMQVKFDYLIGTMIELPRACMTADEIADHADFFSFGTNDLTQTTFGFSRDDIGGFLYDYLNKSILACDPFESIDRDGVGRLVQLAIKSGREKKSGLKIGFCGEQGGDPKSISFFNDVRNFFSSSFT